MFIKYPKFHVRYSTLHVSAHIKKLTKNILKNKKCLLVSIQKYKF